jgi:zinc transporter, ZIP family
LQPLPLFVKLRSMNDIIFAFGLTLFAGLATGIGSILAFTSKKTSPQFLAGALGFSAGVMIYVSLIEIFVKANDSLGEALGASAGYRLTTLSFFGGIALIAIIDQLVPEYENPHELRGVDDMKKSGGGTSSSASAAPGTASAAAESRGVDNENLKRMGFFSALAIAIHNFPEGLATFTGALQDPTLGVSIAVAIAIHNIPEGIAVSVPLYYATGDKKKAFGWSFLSGLAEPVGALVGYFLLMQFFNELMFGILFAGVAGIMVYISLDELLPTAEKYGEHHIAIMGVIAGMVVMAVSLNLFV